MRVVLSPNPYRDKGLKAAQAARKIFLNDGVEVVMCLPFELDAGARVDLPRELEFHDIHEMLPTADMLVCFGGDGTILHAAKYANPHAVPILGVNMGSVGFMAELEHSELSHLSKVAAGKFTIEGRMMLDVRILRGGAPVFEDVALNDAVITKGAMARVVDLEVYGDGVLISEFSGDGVVVSTPTGSTAYSLAAGGPIVEATAENLIFTPICAHALYAKSFVLGSERVVTVRSPRASRKAVYLSVDGGRAVRLSGGDMVSICKSRRQTRLIRLTGRSFYEVVNQKFRRT